jgi:hypothetical protein
VFFFGSVADDEPAGSDAAVAELLVNAGEECDIFFYR